MNRSGNLPFATYNPYLGNSSALGQVNNPAFAKRKFKKRKRPNASYNSGNFNNASQNEGDYDPSWEYSDHGGHSPRREYSPRSHEYNEFRYSPPVSKRMNFQSPERDSFYERESSPERGFSPSPPRNYGNSRGGFGNNKKVPRRFSGPKPNGSPKKINPWANGPPKPKWQNSGPKFGPGNSKGGPSFYKPNPNQAKKVFSPPMNKNPNYKGNKPNNKVHFNPNQANKKVINHPHKIQIKEPLKNPPKYIPQSFPKNPPKSPQIPPKATQPSPQNPPKVPQKQPPAPILFLNSTAKETYSGPPHLRVSISSEDVKIFGKGFWLSLTRRSQIEAHLLKALDEALKNPNEVKPLFDSMEFSFKLVKITCHNDESLAWLQKVLGAMTPPYVTKTIQEVSKYSLVTLELPNGVHTDIMKRLHGQNRQIDMEHWIVLGSKRKGALVRFTFLINPEQTELLKKAEKKVYYLFSAISVYVYPYKVDQPINYFEYVPTSKIMSGSLKQGEDKKTSSEEPPKKAEVPSKPPPAVVKIEKVTVQAPEASTTVAKEVPVKIEETNQEESAPVEKTEEVKSTNPDSADFLPLEEIKAVEPETVDLTDEVEENNVENIENNKAASDDLPNQMDVCQSPFNVDGDEDIMAGFEILSDA